MALYGVVSDIHGNLEALQAALRFLHEREVDGILCLGDIVGYNADPDACVELLERALALSVAGNHDLVAAGRPGSERCSLRAAFALRRTRKALGEASRSALSALPLLDVVEDEIVLTHGGIGDVWQYVTTGVHVEENHRRLRDIVPRARICLFGHTHQQRLYEVQGATAIERERGPELELSGPGRVFFVNPGSIDAARRSGEKLAELLVLDSSRRTVSFHRVPYDHERSERRAAEHGYRMTPLEGYAFRAGRALLEARRRVLAGLRRVSRWV